LPGIDLPAVAEGLGVKGIRVDRAADLHEILREALTFDGTVVVDVSVAPLRGVGPI
jgi:thiamine pyrophosphate-dependent acetolactate synthase large subunit-like protein